MKVLLPCSIVPSLLKTLQNSWEKELKRTPHDKARNLPLCLGIFFILLLCSMDPDIYPDIFLFPRKFFFP